MRRRGSLVSPESSADGFISKFKNTDRRDGGDAYTAYTLTETHTRSTWHSLETALVRSDDMKSISF